MRIRRWHPGLRTKLIAMSFVPTAIILAAVALIGFYAYQRITEDLVIQRNQELARLSAAQVTTQVNSFATTLSSLARTADFYGNNSIAQQVALKLNSNRLVVFDAGVVVLNNYGIVSAAEPMRMDMAGQDWSNRDYFRQLLRSPAPAYSDVVNDGAGGAYVVAVAVPMTTPSGEFAGAMVGMFRLGQRTVSSFYGSLVKLRLSAGAVSYIVDGNGLVIYHRDQERVGEDFSRVEAVRNVTAGGAGALRTTDVNGASTVSSFAPVPGTNWGMVSEESWATLMQPSRRYQRWLLGLLALGVAVPALVVGYSVGRITKPITDMTAAAKAVAAGNFGRTIAAPTGDELEALAQQFNIMSTELKESYTNLEKRVADRTRDLAALNDIGTVVSSSLDLEEVLQGALEKTMEVIGADGGIAYHLDASTQILHAVAGKGLSSDFLNAVSALPLQATLTGKTFSSGTQNSDAPLTFAQADRPDDDLKRWIAGEGLERTISVPLVAKGKLLGAMVLATKAARRLSSDEASLLSAIGRQVGMAVENVHLYEQAEESAVIAERQRLARELHDAVTQTLFSASLIADVLPRIWERSPDEGRRRLAELRELTRGALAEMRTLLHELRPSSLTETALGDLLRQLAEATSGRSRIPVTLNVESQCPLPPNVQVALYRIAQEALNNVAKHAGGATQALITLRCQKGGDAGEPSYAELSVCDDGAGYEPDKVSTVTHLGLGIMKERATAIGAILCIESTPGHGTLVSVRWSGDNKGTTRK